MKEKKKKRKKKNRGCLLSGVSAVAKKGEVRRTIKRRERKVKISQSVDLMVGKDRTQTKGWCQERKYIAKKKKKRKSDKREKVQISRGS